MEDGRLEESQSLEVSTTLSLESFTLSLRSFYHARITPMSPTLLLWMSLLTFIAHTCSHTHTDCIYTNPTNTLNTKQKLLLTLSLLIFRNTNVYNHSSFSKQCVLVAIIIIFTYSVYSLNFSCIQNPFYCFIFSC